MKMMPKKLFKIGLIRQCWIGAVLLCLFAAVPLRAQEAHFGFVKTERIFREAASAKVAELRLKQEFSKRDKDIVDLGVAFKSDVEKFQLESPTLSEAQRAARQKQLADQDRALQLLRRNFQEDLRARKNDELQSLIASANKIIKQIAETEKFDFIFQDAVYVNPKYDMTDRVLKALDAQGDK
jgi:outer membrane protein